MTLDIYELIPKLERLKILCAQHQITLDPETGQRMFYQGQIFTILSAQGNRLALTDDLPKIPFDASHVFYVEDWEEEESCYFLPRVEDLLQIIRDRTTLFPSMTPGVKITREVWQVRHGSGATVVSGSLLEGLLDMAIELLQENS